MFLCNLKQGFSMLGEYFPNVRRLFSIYNHLVATQPIRMPIPNLQEIFFESETVEELLSDQEYLKLFFQSTPQLKVVKLQRSFDIRFFKHINECLHQLQELNVRQYDSNSINYTSHNDPIHFKSVKICLYSQMIRSPEALTRFYFSFDHLEECNIQGISYNQLLEFVKIHSTITKLTIDINDITRDLEKVFEITI